MGLTVHHLQVSQSERIVWLCEELGISYTLKLYSRSPLFAPPDYKALHPLGSAPVIEDDSSDNRIILAESEACAMYINSVYGQNRLAVELDQKDEYAAYLYWMAFVNGTLQPAVARILGLRYAGLSVDHPSVVRAQARVEQCLGLLEQRLERRQEDDVTGEDGEEGKEDWFVGARDRLTLADIMLVFTLSTMRKFAPQDLTPFPSVVAYLGRIAEREAYRRAISKGDPTLNIAEIMAAPPPMPFDATL